MTQTPEVICIGDSCVDVYLPPLSGSYLGGNAVNTAVAVRKAGRTVGYAGAVGSDEAGRVLLQRLRARQIQTQYVRIHSAPTNRSYTRPLPGGEHAYAHELNPPRLPLAFSTEAIASMIRARIVHANWLWPQFAGIAAFRLTPGLTISMDYGPCLSGDFVDHTLPYTKLAFFSLPEARAEEASALAEGFYKRGPRVVVITLGSLGSLVYNGQLHRQAALPVEVVDTLGAGDALIGAFLGATLNGLPAEAALLAGARAAARTCEIPGAWPGAGLKDDEPAGEQDKG